MMKDLWLPKGYALKDGSIIGNLLYSDEGWQIFDTTGADTILVSRPELAQKWCKTGFLNETLLGKITFGTDAFRTLKVHKKYALYPLKDAQSPEGKVDAISFGLALKESRQLLSEVSFHDAIYVEQYSRLLPTWTLTPYVEDEFVLGTWITGGVVISIQSFRRLKSLIHWLSPEDLVKIVETAGLPIPDNIGLTRRNKSQVQLQGDQSAAVSSEMVTDKLSQSQAIKTKQKVFSLPGRPLLEKFFNEHVVDIIFNAEKYHALGVEFPSAVVLHGPPGCGKTFAVRMLMDFIDWPSYSIASSSVGSPYIHETSKKISQVFDKAINEAPSIIVIDEMESFLSDRWLSGTSRLHHVEEVAEFLRIIPEAINNKVLIIGMTNRIDLIDAAILRKGRFDHIIEVGMPTRDEVSSLLDSLLNKLPKSDKLNLDRVLDKLTGKPLSDSAFVVREAARIAAKTDKVQIDQESINLAIKCLPDDKEKKTRRIGFAWDS